jgi:3-oxoadipate enol-lactonase
MVTADLNWFTCYEALGERFRVLAIDHRGHGGGIRSWRPFRLSDCADDAAALAQQLGVEKLTAVGYSMGGSVAQLLWRRHPELVEGLVLCATSRSFSGQHRGSQIYFASLLGLSVATRFTPRPVVRNFYGHLVRQRASGTVDAWGLAELQRSDTSTVLGAGWAIGRFESREWIGSVDVPTAVVITNADQVVRPSRQRALARAVPGASVHEVEAGHAACVTHPELFVPALLDACHTVTSRAHPASRVHSASS